MWPELSLLSALAPLHVVGKGAWVAEVWRARVRRENRCPLIREPALNQILTCPQPAAPGELSGSSSPSPTEPALNPN